MIRVAVVVMSILSAVLLLQHTKVVQANRTLLMRVAILSGDDIPIGNKVSHLVGVGLDGRRLEYSLNASRRPTLVFTLATGCPGCVRSLSAWRRLAQGGAQLGIDTVVVSNSWLADVQDFVAVNDVAGIVMADATYATFLGLRLKVTPHAVIFAPGGTVAHMWKGALDADMEKEILTALRSSTVGLAVGASHRP